MEWYNIFSYWGFGFWFAWLLGAPVQPLSVILANLLFSIFFVMAKYKGLSPVALFILVTHTIPLYSLRQTEFQPEQLLYLYSVYMAWLLSQGLTPARVYKSIFDEPPHTVREYLRLRKIYN